MSLVGRRSRSKRNMRDYHKAKYGNPLFKNRTGQRRRNDSSKSLSWKMWLFIIVLIGGIGSLGWYLFWSPSFTIDTIEISGTSLATEKRIHELIEQRMEAKKLLFFPQTSIFLFDKSEAIDTIRDYYHLENLEVKKKLPKTITISATEIPIRAVLAVDKDFLAVSETGSIVRSLTEREVRKIGDLPPNLQEEQSRDLGAEVIKLEDLDNESSPTLPENTNILRNKNAFPLLLNDENDYSETKNPKPGESLFSSTTIALVLQANARLPDITGDEVRWFTIQERNEAVNITMQGDWYILLTTALPFEIQGSRLNLVLKDKVADRKDTLEYIDLRYNERIYTKFEDDTEVEEGGDAKEAEEAAVETELN